MAKHELPEGMTSFLQGKPTKWQDIWDVYCHINYPGGKPAFAFHVGTYYLVPGTTLMKEVKP